MFYFLQNLAFYIPLSENKGVPKKIVKTFSSRIEGNLPPFFVYPLHS